MTRKPEVTAEKATLWEELLGKHRPEAPTEDDCKRSIPVLSFNLSGSTHGIFLRLQTETGQADVFLNGAVAIQLAGVIHEMGIAAGWMNEDDTSLIVRDPASLRYNGRKS